MENKEIDSIIDYGLASENKQKIIKFLDKIYKIPIDKPEIWEKEIFSFFSEELIVPYIISTSTNKERCLMEEIKKDFFNTMKLIHIWSSNEFYKNLIKIRESLKTGIPIKEYILFFFQNNIIIRRMYVKRIDEKDSTFHNFKSGIQNMYSEIYSKENKIIGYEKIYFLIPDQGVDYPLERWYKEINKKWRLKLKFNNKQNNNKRKPLDTKLRHECFKRDNYKCLECGATNKDKILHADHIVPVSQGGSDELSNLQTLCQDCNLAKSNKKWIGGNGK